MKLIVSFLVMLITCAHAQDTHYLRVVPSLKGNIVYFHYGSGFKYSLYRGLDESNLELIQTSGSNISTMSHPGSINWGEFLDNTAELNTKYFYKVVAESKVLSGEIEKPERLLFLKDFASGDNFGDSGQLHERFNGGWGSLQRFEMRDGGEMNIYQSQGSSYEQSFKQIEYNKNYKVKVYLGKVSGLCKLQLALSRKAQGLTIHENDINKYQDDVIETQLNSGPQSWARLSLAIIPVKKNNCSVKVKKIMVIDDI